MTREGIAKKKRKDMPVVKASNKGDSQRVFDIAMDPLRRAQALQSFEEDIFAITSRAPRDANLATWIRFHHLWFGCDVHALPLTVDKITRFLLCLKLVVISPFETIFTEQRITMLNMAIRGQINCKGR